MNGKQKLTAFLGLVVIAVMVLFPPWIRWEWGIGPRPVLPPGFVGVPEVRIQKTFYAPIFNRPNYWKSPLDLRRLALQCGAVLSVTGILLVKFRNS